MLKKWYEAVDPSRINSELRYRLLRYLVSTRGEGEARRILGVSKSTLYRLLRRQVGLTDENLRRILGALDPEEFEKIASSEEKLRALGVLGDNGAIDYAIVLEILGVAARDPYLRQLILRFTVENFREDLRRILGISLTGVKMKWTQDFEIFLRERKKRRKVRGPETLKYYKSLFKKYLEGKELSEELIDYVVNHPNKWLRNIFRHYIQYLYYKRRISPETFGWIMEVVPSRSYRLDVRPYQISLEDVKKTLEFLEQRHSIYYTIYRVMLESGARFEHVLKMAETWSPNEVVEIPGVGIETRRLVCFEDQGFCRYYMGLREGSKPCEWIYMGIETLKLLQNLAPRRINRNQVTKYAKRHGLVLPKYMRKIAWRLMIKAVSREVARFIQSRLGELRVSEARYEDLLGEADEAYPKYLKHLEKQLENTKTP